MRNGLISQRLGFDGWLHGKPFRCLRSPFLRGEKLLHCHHDHRRIVVEPSLAVQRHCLHKAALDLFG